MVEELLPNGLKDKVCRVAMLPKPRWKGMSCMLPVLILGLFSTAGRRANNKALCVAECIYDEVFQKTQLLVRSHCNEDMLYNGLDRFAYVKWITTGVEQGQGSIAHMHRCHTTMEVSMLATRPILHSARLLLYIPTGREAHHGTAGSVA